jgi:hypothetical protein
VTGIRSWAGHSMQSFAGVLRSVVCRVLAMAVPGVEAGQAALLKGSVPDPIEAEHVPRRPHTFARRNRESANFGIEVANRCGSVTESAALVVGGVSDPETFLAPGRIAVRDRSYTPGRIGGPSQERDRGTPPKVSRTQPLSPLPA